MTKLGQAIGMYYYATTAISLRCKRAGSVLQMKPRLSLHSKVSRGSINQILPIDRESEFRRVQCCESLPISTNKGKYMEMTMPPTTRPRTTIIIGSIAANRSFTAESTSSS
jgi:hypothetical protein